MITLDTSGLLAVLHRRDPDHVACRRVIEDDGGPFIVPAAILGEVGWFLEQRFPLDRRHFSVVARGEKALSLLPE